MAQFRLQRVLDLRKRREEEQLGRLALATQARMRAQGELDGLVAEEQAQREALGARLQGRIDPGEVAEFGRILNLYGVAIAGKRAELERRIAAEETERLGLTAATIDRKALDRVRERHVERETAERNHREAGFLDEIAAARSTRIRLAAAAAVVAGGGR